MLAAEKTNRRNKWTEEEDEFIHAYIEGGRKTDLHVPGRSLDGIKNRLFRLYGCKSMTNTTKKMTKSKVNAPWTTVETGVLRLASGIYGNKWREITDLLPGRSEDAIRNRCKRVFTLDLKVVEKKGKKKHSAPTSASAVCLEWSNISGTDLDEDFFKET